jgi:mono/diheme cytochrome c family protein
MRRALAPLLLLLAGCPVPQRPPGPPSDQVHPTPLAGNQPVFGQTVQATRAVPPLSGGTLLLLADGRTAMAADPDRDRLSFVDVTEASVIAEVPLIDGDQPGRSVEDATGAVHVVLRGGGAVLSLRRDAGRFTISARRPICAAPRGIAYDRATDHLHVACAGGELVSLPAAGGEAVRTVMLPIDLRDVVVSDGVLYVSRFRSAEILRLDPQGAIGQRLSPPKFGASTPAVAWRMRAIPGGGLALVHQLDLEGPVQTSPGGYGGNGDCQRPVTTAITVFGPGGVTVTQVLPRATVPVDLAVSSDGGRGAVVAAGNAHLSGAFQLVGVEFGDLMSSATAPSPLGGCGGGTTDGLPQPQEQAVAAAMDATGAVLVQTRDPATLVLPSGRVVTLARDARADTGYSIFHSSANTATGIACASCHPEGGEDGHVWTFANLGPRRTQSLRGSPAPPYHWDGALHSLPALLDEVFSSRMSGPPLDAGEQAALGHFLSTIPPLPLALDETDAVARGRALFQDPLSGCATCHTAHQMADVGTGGTFKAPSLAGVRWRAPYLHDGCAPTLADRFGPCGGGDRHGVTSALGPTQIDDLVAYLQSL